MITLRLTDDSEGIEIVKSGAPAPSRNLCEWLDRECRGAWHTRIDNVFNVYFDFEDPLDAARFKERWKAYED